jgi:folate-binding protein YgfZ
VNREALEREHAAATQGAGFFLLDRWTTVRVTGSERASFLHNMCTNDIKSLKEGEGCEAFFTDVKGKIVAHTLVLVAELEVLLLAVPGQAQRLISHLDRYIIREDVQLVEQSVKLAWMLVLGQNASAVVRQLAPDVSNGLSTIWAHANSELGGSEIRIVKTDLPWCGGDLIGFRSDHAEVMRLRLAEADVAQCSEANWHAIRVESAWPLWGVDFDDSNLPQEVGRDDKAIHFRKGCYLGQETVARIDALGHVNQQLVQVRFAGEEAPAAGAELSQGERKVGTVTSSTWSPRMKTPLAIAMVRRGANERGSRIECCGIAGEIIDGVSSTV